MPSTYRSALLCCLQDVQVAFIAAGSAAAHCIVGDVNGVCYTWGRNEVRRDVLHSGAGPAATPVAHMQLERREDYSRFAEAAPATCQSNKQLKLSSTCGSCWLCHLQILAMLHGTYCLQLVPGITHCPAACAAAAAAYCCLCRLLLLQRGQLGHGDLLQRNSPTIVAGLQGQHVVAGENVELAAAAAARDNACAAMLEDARDSTW
jgi:hypothetical protein